MLPIQVPRWGKVGKEQAILIHGTLTWGWRRSRSSCPSRTMPGSWSWTDEASATVPTIPGRGPIGGRAERIGARFHQVAGADHLPHQQRPDEVNRLLIELWGQAGELHRRPNAPAAG